MRTTIKQIGDSVLVSQRVLVDAPRTAGVFFARFTSQQLRRRAIGVDVASNQVGSLDIAQDVPFPVQLMPFNHEQLSSIASVGNTWWPESKRASDASHMHRLHPKISARNMNLATEGLLRDLLIDQGVTQIFGYPGGIQVPMFDAVFAAEKFNSVFARHEQGTGHMAEGYARASGRPGVAFVISGPGLTNMVTAMQDALSDGTPMIVISAEVPHVPGWDGRDTVDVIGISESCTKWNVTVRSPQDLPEKINKAFEVATSGRPGPVLVHIPKTIDSVSTTKPSCPSVALKRRAAGVKTELKPGHESKQALSRVARLVNISKKPVLYVGQGMLARPEGTRILKEFADKTAIPVTTSLQGLGAFDELDPKALHMLGLHGSAYANLAIQESDLIMALGARFDDRVTGNIAKFAPKAISAAAENRGGIVHFDIAPKNINKVVAVNEAVQGDCSESLAELTNLVRAVDDRPEWFKQIDEWKRKFPFSAYKEVVTLPSPGLIRAQEVIERLSNITNHMKDRTIISTGVGQHQMWAAQHFRWRHPRTMVTSGGLGTMGFGLPAAIGAKLAHPDSLVIDIDGDASFNMTIAELATAAQYNIGVKVLLFNNEQMGMVSDLQRLYYKGKFVHNRQGNPDFVKASRAWGVEAERCSRVSDIDEKLRWLLETEGPAVLEVVTEQNSPVWPVVPAGKGLHEFVTYGVGLSP